MSGARNVGFVEWFRPGDYDRVEDALQGLSASGARYLRTHLSWAEYLAPGGEEWFDWLMPKLGQAIDLLPCIHYTPPSLSRTGRANGAPRDLKAYADFTDHALTRYGRHFSHVELWNEPNNLLDWDWREDPSFLLFCEMVGGAAYWVRKRGWKAVLGGPYPIDPVWLDMMGERGVLQQTDAVGLHGFPGTWDSEEGSWNGWDVPLAEMRAVLDRHNRDAKIWITRTAMRRMSWSPSVRLFEAAACGTPIVSDVWRGIDELFANGDAIVLARGSEDVVEALTAISETRRRAIGRKAERIVRAGHTGTARAREFVLALETQLREFARSVG